MVVRFLFPVTAVAVFPVTTAVTAVVAVVGATIDASSRVVCPYT